MFVNLPASLYLDCVKKNFAVSPKLALFELIFWGGVEGGRKEGRADVARRLIKEVAQNGDDTAFNWQRTITV